MEKFLGKDDIVYIVYLFRCQTHGTIRIGLSGTRRALDPWLARALPIGSRVTTCQAGARGTLACRAWICSLVGLAWVYADSNGYNRYFSLILTVIVIFFNISFIYVVCTVMLLSIVFFSLC